MKKQFFLLVLPIVLLTTGCAHIQKQSSETEYRNARYGFSLTYPTVDWIVDETSDPLTEGSNVQVKLISKKTQEKLRETGGYSATADIFVKVFDSVADLPDNETNKQNLRDWIAQKFSERWFYSVEEITFAGSPAFTTLSGSIDAGDPGIYVEHNEKIYLIQEERVNEDDPQNKKNEKVIQMFQFTE